jgi:hypothetical protein
LFSLTATAAVIAWAIKASTITVAAAECMTTQKHFFLGATKKRPFGKKKRPFFVNFSMRESEAHRKGPRKSFLSKAAVCVEKTAVWRKKSGASDFHHQAH